MVLKPLEVLVEPKAAKEKTNELVLFVEAFWEVSCGVVGGVSCGVVGGMSCGVVRGDVLWRCEGGCPVAL